MLRYLVWLIILKRRELGVREMDGGVENDARSPVLLFKSGFPEWGRFGWSTESFSSFARRERKKRFPAFPGVTPLITNDSGSPEFPTAKKRKTESGGIIKL